MKKISEILTWVIQVIKWKFQLHKAYYYMLLVHTIDSLYALLMLQYRRPMTPLQKAANFIYHYHCDSESEKAFLKLVQRRRIMFHLILGFSLLGWIGILIWGLLLNIPVNDYENIITVGIGLLLFILSFIPWTKTLIKLKNEDVEKYCSKFHSDSSNFWEAKNQS